MTGRVLFRESADAYCAAPCASLGLAHRRLAVHRRRQAVAIFHTLLNQRCQNHTPGLYPNPPPTRGVAGIEVHTHSTTLYNSLYRFDDVMLVNTHIWGVSAFAAPVLHLRRLGAGGLFDNYAQSFEDVWATSVSAYPADAALA